VMEPFGLVPLESMACGTPVVAVAEGGVRESVTHGKTGLLAERLPQQFAEALRSLLEDPTLGARLGGYAREEALERWRWERTVMQIEAHLAELLNENGTSEV
jgi:glycosyltransferase involved in cell wall biosynthesis